MSENETKPTPDLISSQKPKTPKTRVFEYEITKTDEGKKIPQLFEIIDDKAVEVKPVSTDKFIREKIKEYSTEEKATPEAARANRNWPKNL